MDIATTVKDAPASEYQYYEFQAIDRPLDDDGRIVLRALSTRAKIARTNFTNTYNFGDFHGDPVELMKRWFDLHLYLANWDTRRLMIRVPKRLIKRRNLDRFLRRVECARIHLAGENLILDIHRDEMELEDWNATRMSVLNCGPKFASDWWARPLP